MKEERYFYVPRVEAQGLLPDEEAVHALRVLRLKEGDEMVLMDGRGTFHHAVVSLADGKRCHYVVAETLPQEPAWRGHHHLAIAPTKMMERMEWLVEKATEVGIDELTFLDCRFSERRVVKMPRVEKIAIAAMKQSRKAWLPRLNPQQDFDAFIARHSTGPRYIAHCYEEVPRVNLFSRLDGGDALVLVGPVGDFSIDEVRKAVAAGFISVDLGKSRLRTETAGLAAVMMMQLSGQ